MKICLQEDWLAPYVAYGRIQLPTLPESVPTYIAEEIHNLEPVSLTVVSSPDGILIGFYAALSTLPTQIWPTSRGSGGEHSLCLSRSLLCK